MKNKTLVLILFLVVAVVQVYIPGSMVYQSEIVAQRGTTYKFKTEPVDPTDPFRGKYITLSFESDEVRASSGQEWENNEIVYITLKTNSKGFAELQDAYKGIPEDTNEDYIKATVIRKKSSYLHVKLPFNRLYMEESKAYEAELAYRDAISNTKESSYAAVKVKNGKAVLLDVYLGDRNIKEVVEERLNEQPIQTIK